MLDHHNRRSFLKTSSVAMATAAGLPCLATSSVHAGQFTGRIRKAVKYHMITEKLSAADKLKMLMDLGYDGVEPRAMLKPAQASEVAINTWMP